MTESLAGQRDKSTEVLKEKPHIAIAGAAGRVGRRLQAFGSSEYRITALEHTKPITGRETVEQIMSGFDVTDLESVKKIVAALQKNGIRSLINCTGDVRVDQMENERGDNSSNMYKVNVEGAANLALACRESGLKLVHLSTEYVFNGKIPEGQKYTTKDSPDTDIKSAPTFYGLAKAWGEQVITEIYPEGSVIIRVGQVQGIAGGHFLATLKQLEKGEKFTRARNQLMTPIVDETATRAISLIEGSLHTRKFDSIYHVNATDAYTSYEVALMLADAFGMGEKAREIIEPVTLEELVERGEQKVVRPKNTVLDNSGFEKEFRRGVLHTIAEEIQIFKKLYQQQIFPRVS